MLGLFELPFLYKEKKVDYNPAKANLINSFLLGMAFSAGWTPCVGPILSTILIYVSSSKTVWLGGRLLAAYSLGLGIPFLLIALFISYALDYLDKLKRYLDKVSMFSGVLLIIMWILMFTNYF